MPVPRVRETLYEQDFVAWTEEQAAHARAGRVSQLDLENIAEELEDMGRSERRELKNRLEVLVAHLLKRRILPDRRERSWDATINEQRRAIRRLLEDSPSLKATLDEAVREMYADGRARAADETGLPAERFPTAPPFGTPQVLGDDESGS